MALKLNPDAEYNQKRRETRDIRFKPSEDDVIIEMERFLDNPWVMHKNIVVNLQPLIPMPLLPSLRFFRHLEACFERDVKQ